MIGRAIYALLALVVTVNVSAAEVPEPIFGEPLPPEERIQVEAILDVPLRDPSICKGPDGTFYLTGTLSFKDEGEDFDNNPGIRLWKSQDLKNWEDLGLVWNPAKSRDRRLGWLKAPVGEMDRYDTLRHRNAITAPEIHYFKETFWICYSRNDYGTGLIKSVSGKPEGPYVPPGPHGMITNWGRAPSIFQDADGAIYWLWASDAPFIARMREDMSGLAEPPRLLTCQMPENDARIKQRDKDVPDDIVGRGGPFLYRVGGKYHLTAADIINKHGITAGNVFVAVSSESVYGPYGAPRSFIPHGGQTTVFNDGAGQWYATYGGRDRFSAFRDRAGLIPLEWLAGYTTDWHPFGEGPIMTRNRHRVFTERGPWHKTKPVLSYDPEFADRMDDMQIWDTGIIQAPDGYFYFTGSQYGPDLIKKLRVWRSRDLRDWESFVVRTHQDEKAFSQARKDFVASGPNWGNCYMDCKISWLPREKTFAVSYTCYGTKLPQFSKDKGEQDSCAGVLVSESGEIEGPWVWHDWAPHSAHYIQLEDGRTLVGGGIADIHVLKPRYWDEHGKEGTRERWQEYRVHGSRAMPPDTFGQYIEDSWGQLIRIGDKWVCLRTEQPWRWFADPFDVRSYTSAFCTADRIEGPWTKWKPAVRYGGHAGICKGLDGHYYGLAWANTANGVAPMSKPLMVRLNVEMQDGELSIDIDPDWTPADYAPVTEYRGEGKWSPYTDFARDAE